jgi:outer membrane scaffolding protein for murein synthesis (MipA/OmpV family)
MTAATREFLPAPRWRSFVLAAFAPFGVAGASDLPRWELGAGMAVAHLPDYRGAGEGRAYVLPVPYFVYRGERLRADRDGLRGEIFESERLDLNVSVGLGVPVRSSDNEARRGMARLDPVVEAGPSLNVRLSGDASGASDWRLSLPLRAAFAVDDTRLRSAGAVFSPRLRYGVRDVAWLGRGTLRVAFGPNFGTREYHGYTYDVPAASATATRPAYAARGGYSGASLSLTIDRSAGAHRVYVYVAAESIRGAAFDDSPLVRRSANVGAGFAYFYVFASGGTGVAPR